MRGLKEKYEIHHKVRILAAAIIAAAKLPSRHNTARFLPNKEIDLMDKAASMVKLELAKNPEQIKNNKTNNLIENSRISSIKKDNVQQQKSANLCQEMNWKSLLTNETG